MLDSKKRQFVTLLNGAVMQKYPPDIEKLEKMYVGGETDNELCSQAVLIAVRLRNEFAFAGTRLDYARMKSLSDEKTMFNELRERIAKRSDTHDVFALYKKFVTAQGIVL